MLAVAAAEPWVRGVVAWVPLDDPAATANALDARDAPVLCGVRHLIHREPDPDWLLRPAVMPGLREVARRGLTFDVVAVFPDHLRHVPDARGRASGPHAGDRSPGQAAVPCPGLAGVAPSDHAPPPGGPTSSPRSPVSTTAAGPGWTGEELRPALEVALEAFGADRLLFGSDWPVCLLASSYAEHLEVLERLIGGLAADERAAIMGGTATRVYRLADVV